jgi:hypothetical protein
VTWQELAKDAFEVKKEGPKADQRVAIGETFDFEYRRRKPAKQHSRAGSPGMPGA